MQRWKAQVSPPLLRSPTSLLLVKVQVPAKVSMLAGEHSSLQLHTHDSQERWNPKDNQEEPVASASSPPLCSTCLVVARPEHSLLSCCSPRSCSEPAVLCAAAHLCLPLQGPFRVHCCFSK